MPSLKIAHIREQGQDLIIAPLAASFGRKSQEEQRRIIAELQQKCSRAGLKGQVALVWDGGSGRMMFMAPKPWEPFFSGVTLEFVLANLNHEVRW